MTRLKRIVCLAVILTGIGILQLEAASGHDLWRYLSTAMGCA